MKIAFTKIFLMSRIPFKIAWMDLVWWLLGSRATMIYTSKLCKPIDSFKDMLRATFLPLFHFLHNLQKIRIVVTNSREHELFCDILRVESASKLECGFCPPVVAQ